MSRRELASRSPFQGFLSISIQYQQVHIQSGVKRRSPFQGFLSISMWRIKKDILRHTESRSPFQGFLSISIHQFHLCHLCRLQQSQSLSGISQYFNKKYLLNGFTGDMDLVVVPFRDFLVFQYTHTHTHTHTHTQSQSLSGISQYFNPCSSMPNNKHSFITVVVPFRDFLVFQFIINHFDEIGSRLSQSLSGISQYFNIIKT